MKKRFFKTFFISFLAFVVLYSVVIYYLLNNQSEVKCAEDKNFLERLVDNDIDEITFLLLGIDTNDVTKDSRQRSDTIMLCKFDKSTGGISVLSIPRDTRVNIRGRKNKDKINHAHAYGGPELSVKTVKDLLGINLDYYVRVDYKIVEEVVDLIDGVEVNVPMNMYYNDPIAKPPLHINLKKGKQVLNGDKALQFLRFRKGYANQDLGRIEAQQQFIKACVDKILKPQNLMKVPQMIKAYYEYVDTNIPLDVIMKFGLKVKDINMDNIKMATLPGRAKSINKISYFIPYTDECDELVEDMFTDHKAVENKIDENDEKIENN